MSITVGRCPCGHKDLDHERRAGVRCSMGGCPCTRSAIDVRENCPQEQIPTFPTTIPMSARLEAGR